MLSKRHGWEERDMDGGHANSCKCFTAHPQSLQRQWFCCGRRQFARPHCAHHLEEISKGNCARLSFKRYKPLEKVCVQYSWGSPSSTTLLSLLWDRELKSFNGAAMIESVMWAKSSNCWVLSRCFLYVFTPEVVWLPVLQLSKTEDSYAPRGATFRSRLQSPSLGSSGLRQANPMADNINFLSSILRTIHYYINVSTVILLQFTYYTNIHTYLARVMKES